MTDRSVLGGSGTERNVVGNSGMTTELEFTSHTSNNAIHHTHNQTLNTTSDVLFGTVQTNSLDRSTAGTLTIGGTTQTQLNLGRLLTPVVTVGPVQMLNSSLDMAGALNMNLGTVNANLINIGQSSIDVAVQGRMVSNQGLDRVTAGAMNLGTGTATSVLIGRATMPTTVQGTLACDSGLDRSTAGAMNLGTGTATSVLIGRSAMPTTVQGTLACDSGLDRSTAGAMNLGTGTATSVTIGRSSMSTTVAGNATISGTSLLTGNVTLAGTIDKSTAAGLSIGATNATSITVAKSGVPTTVAGTLAVTQGATCSSTLGVAGTLTVNNGTGNSFDLPASRGTSGYCFVSNGNTAPGWVAVNRMALPFGGDWASGIYNTLYAVAGGTANDTPGSLSVPTTYLSPITGNVVGVAYNTTSGDVTSTAGILVDGTQYGFYLTGAGGYQSLGPYPVSQSQRLGIFFGSGTPIGKSNFLMYVQ